MYSPHKFVIVGFSCLLLTIITACGGGDPAIRITGTTPGAALIDPNTIAPTIAIATPSSVSFSTIPTPVGPAIASATGLSLAPFFPVFPTSITGTAPLNTRATSGIPVTNIIPGSMIFPTTGNFLQPSFSRVPFSLTGLTGNITSAPLSAAIPSHFLGITTAGVNLETFVLDDGQYWSIYGSTDAISNRFLILGFEQGVWNANSDNFLVPDLRDFSFTGNAFAGAIIATRNLNADLSGVLTLTSLGKADFTMLSQASASSSSSRYNFFRAANIAEVTGTWQMQTAQGLWTVTIAPTGAVTVILQSGCSATGTLAPDFNGKNVFTITFQTSLQTCPSGPNQFFTGIAFSAIQGDSRRSFTIMVVNSTRTKGTIAFGEV